MNITEVTSPLSESNVWLPVRNVAADSWEQSNSALMTKAAHAGIVLAAYNDSSHQGLLGHFSHLISTATPYSSSIEEFNEAVSAVVDLGEARHTSLWVGGASPLATAPHNSVAYDRTYAIGSLRGLLIGMRLKPASLHVDWTIRPETMIDVGLDCKLGELAVGRYTAA